MLGFRLSQSLDQSHRLDQRNSLALRLTLTQRLVRRINGDGCDYKPQGTCPSCQHRLTPSEIIRGFNRNPADYTTKCPKCSHRFQPIMVSRGVASVAQVPFLCPSQTLAILQPEMLGLSPELFRIRNPRVYHSALYHFGSLTGAFAKIKLKYRGELKISSWQKKVLSYLGKLPDPIIASAARVSVREVRKLRKEKEIAPYQRGSV